MFWEHQLEQFLELQKEGAQSEPQILLKEEEQSILALFQVLPAIMLALKQAIRQILALQLLIKQLASAIFSPQTRLSVNPIVLPIAAAPPPPLAIGLVVELQALAGRLPSE